jgi:hypothetical protein
LDKKRRRYEKAVSDTVLIRVMVSDKYILKDIFEPFFQQKHGERDKSWNNLYGYDSSKTRS